MVSVADVAPVIGVPLRFHWYVSDPPPAAATLKDACCSSMTVRLAGCAVIVGAVTTKVGVEAGVDAEGDVLLPVLSLSLPLPPPPQPTNCRTTNEAASPMRLVSCIDRPKVGTAFLRNLRFFFIMAIRQISEVFTSFLNNLQTKKRPS